MARLSASLLCLALGAVSALALASCGGGSSADLLPGTTANQINSNLDQVEQLVDRGDCVGAEDAVAAVTQEVEGLREVDLKLKTALEEGAAHLSEVVTECEETSEETEPTLESDVEAGEVEEKKPKKEKPEKEGKGPAEPQEEAGEGEGPELPPQANGKGEENGEGGGPPPSEPEAEEEAPSGGVGPGVGVEE
jgi:hypothetical protein